MKSMFHIIVSFLIILAGCADITVDRNKSKDKESLSTATDYYNRGCNRMTGGNPDYKGAIADFSQAIRLQSDLIVAYTNRGVSKDYLKDHMGAISDYSKAIELSSERHEQQIPHDSYDYIYTNRALAKYNLQDYRGAIEDINKALELSPSDYPNYLYRAQAKYQLNDFLGVVDDCNYLIKLKDIEIFWTDFINFGKAYYLRGLSKIQLGQKDDGCMDLSKAGELGYSKAYDLIKEYCQ